MSDPAHDHQHNVRHLKFARPERLNAFDADELERLHAELAGIEHDVSTAAEPPRAVVLSGPGRAFSAGADLAFVEQLISADDDRRRSGLRLAPRLVQALAQCPLPTVAAVQGPAYGGGACLALACDHIVAARDARLGFVFTALGLPGGDMSAPWLLTRRVGGRRAWQLLTGAAVVEAHDALGMGLVDELVEADQVLARAQAVADDWAQGSPFAIQATKRQILALEGAEHALGILARAEEAEIGVAFGRADVAERVSRARR